jgi:ketosteroid isomerase-like protein
MSADRVRLLERDAEWAVLASEGRDIEAILSYWTDDAVVFVPGLPPVSGKDALREYVRNSLQIPGFNISWKSTDVQVSADSSLAYMFGQNKVTMNGPDGAPVTSEGRGAVDIWNS